MLDPKPGIAGNQINISWQIMKKEHKCTYLEFI